MLATEQWFHMTESRLGASTSKVSKNSKASSAIERGNAYHRKVYNILKLHCGLNHADWTLYVEPWFRTVKYKLRSPDAVLVHPGLKLGLVIEVKMNWKDGRDTKLIEEYLPLVRSAFALQRTVPLLITQNLRGYQHKPLLGVSKLMQPLSWKPEEPTPLMLVVK